MAGAGGAAVAVSAVAVAGCGGGSSGSAAATAASGGGARAAATTLKLTANPKGQLRFMPGALRAAKTGTVTLVMTNPSSTKLMHGIAVEGNGIDKTGPIVGPGKTARLTVTLKKAGAYTFYCPFDGHRAAGMKGTLTVGKGSRGTPAPSTKTTKTAPSRPGY
jgi:uncharacterized cupredoxin-like copper-binding protein